MRSAWRKTRLSGLLLGTLVSSRAWSQPLQVKVGATDGRECAAYFHNVTGKVTYPIVLSLKGTGIYTTARSTEVELALRSLYQRGRITVVTLDKPGVAPSTGAAAVDDAVYNQYVQDDLVRCAENALIAATERAAGTGTILISAHSEGAQIAVRLLTDLVAEHAPMAAQIDSLFLSGLPLTDWRRLLSGQLGAHERDRFFTAFEQRDDVVLRTFGNLSAAYLARAFASESLSATFERLRQLGTTAKIHIYQGLADRNTPAAAVRELEDRNREGPGFKLSAHYYPTGHALSRSAVLDIARDVETAADPRLAQITLRARSPH